MDRAKRWLRRLAGAAGLQIVRNRFGLDVARDLRDVLGSPPKVIFDVGANVGQTATTLAAQFPSAHVFSFEPDPQVFEQLRANVASMPNVSPHPIAFGAENATRSLFVTKSSEGSSLLPIAAEASRFSLGGWAQSAGEKSVRVQRLDRFAAEHGIKTIDLLKSDTQGAELHVFEGAGDLLHPAAIRAIFCEVMFIPVYEGQAFFEQVYARLKDRGYRLAGLYNEVRDRTHRLTWCDALFI